MHQSVLKTRIVLLLYFTVAVLLSRITATIYSEQKYNSQNLNQSPAKHLLLYKVQHTPCSTKSR